jgi:enterochelin esterase-like enzyme
MKTKPLLYLFAPLSLTIGFVTTHAQTVQDSITTLLPDNRVIFRLQAPQANSVSVDFGSPPLDTVTPLTKDSNGLWSVTLGPYAADLYEYKFIVDGVVVTDPGNNLPKPQRQVNTSLLLVPANPPDFIDVQNVPHGSVHSDNYYSNVLGQWRHLLVYVPPGYDRSHFVPLPVLYLYHGFCDTEYSWVTQGRLAELMDNVLAQKKAVPMIVVVPDTEALNPDIVQTSQLLQFLTDDAEAEDKELFNDIIPYVNGHYFARKDSRSRAIAGLSQGGFQTLESGLAHLDYFSALGVFSAGFFGPLPDTDQALQNPERINRQIQYFDVVVGSADTVAGPTAQQLDAELTQLNIRHIYQVVPGGIHSMDVWRPALYNFVQHIFGDQ